MACRDEKCTPNVAGAIMQWKLPEDLTAIPILSTQNHKDPNLHTVVHLEHEKFNANLEELEKGEKIVIEHKEINIHFTAPSSMNYTMCNNEGPFSLKNLLICIRSVIFHVALFENITKDTLNKFALIHREEYSSVKMKDNDVYVNVQDVCVNVRYFNEAQ